MALPEAFVAGRLARGNRCYIAEDAGTVAAYGWLSTGREQVPEFDRAVRPGRHEAYIWDCLTSPKCRGRGLMPAILRRLCADLARQGLRRAWAVILADNYPSQRAFARAGFIPVLNITYRRRPGLSDLALVGEPAAPRALVATAMRLFEV
jgi:ribosomal protein S18 acetylase RimI-like enzyme